MKCTECNIDKEENNFYKHRKKCKDCLIILHNCIHNLRKCRCKICKLIDNKTCIKCKTNFKLDNFPKNSNKCINCIGNKCIHDKIKFICIECDGSSICIHKKIKSKCIECDGGSFCIHKKLKPCCRECKGSHICIHNKNKSTCIACTPKNYCLHKIYKTRCKKCNPDKEFKKYKKIEKRCIHNKKKYYCKECSQNSKAFCKSCKLFRVNDRTNYLCSYCNLDKPNYIKNREVQVKTFLDEQKYAYEYNKFCKYEDKWYYPDFKIKCDNFWIIIECDEKAHKTYDKNDEKERENNIRLALNKKCVFIRFNPDKKEIKMTIKQTILKSYIEYYINKEVCYDEVHYLFYCPLTFSK